MHTIADRIEALLSHLEMNQAELGAIAGVSKQAVSAWITGKSEPQRDALLNMQRRRQINPLWIVDGTPPMRFSGVQEEQAGYQVSLLNGLTRRQRDLVLAEIEGMRRVNQEIVKEVADFYLAKNHSAPTP